MKHFRASITEYFCNWLITNFNIKEDDILNFKKRIYTKNSEDMKFFMNHLSSAKILTRPFAILNLYQIYSYNDRHFTFNLTGVNYSAVSSYLGEKIALEFKDKCNFSDLKDFKCEAAGELKVKKFISIQKIGT